MPIGYDDGIMRFANRRKDARARRKIEIDITHVQLIDPEDFEITGGCDLEVTPECVRGRFD